MIAAGLCGLSIGQDVNQPKKKPAGTLEPTTISNAFTRFLDDGRVCLTNNAAERALRRSQSQRFHNSG